MEQLEATLAQGVSEGRIPHAIIIASSRDGTFNYSHTTGTASEDHKEPIQEDALFQLASSTKLLTCISVLQIVEKGLVGLDDDVAGRLPELAEQKILQGFDEQEKPILVERKNAITLRMLMTHSSGVAYDGFTPELIKYQKQRGVTPATGATVTERFTYPLMFEPGTSWGNGCGFDWAGLLLERVTSVSLDVWVQTNIIARLGIPESDFTFFPSADAVSRMPCVHTRGPTGAMVPTPGPLKLNQGLTTAAFGGHRGHCTMRAYHAILNSLLRSSPDTPSILLNHESVETLFRPTLSSASKAALNALTTEPAFGYFVSRFPTNVEYDFAPGGIVQCVDATGLGRRKQGVLIWGGMANTWFSVDRAAGLAVVFGTQVLLPGDEGVKEMITAVEEAMYRRVGVVV